MKNRARCLLLLLLWGFSTCRLSAARSLPRTTFRHVAKLSPVKLKDNDDVIEREQQQQQSEHAQPLPPQEEESKDTLLSVRGGGASLITTAGAHGPWLDDLLVRLKVGFYFGLWYALNIVYNIVNKKLLNVWPAPMVVGTLQLGIGALYAMLLWACQLRARPELTATGQVAVQKVGLWHSLGHLLTMASLGAGPVSFTHIVKALEPFFSAIVSALCFGKWMKAPVYATLLPVVGGVGYACLKERSFSWLAFGMAMGSNLAFALRAVLSKMAMTATKPGQPPNGTNLSPPNVFALVTIAAFVMSIPLALLGEGSTMASTWSKALKQQSAAELIRGVIVSGLFHYLNNEVMYLALGSVHPVTLAVGNTMKRVFIVVASVIVFQNEITTQTAIGSAIGIGGVLLYSLTKQHYEKLEAAAAANTKEKRGHSNATEPANRRGQIPNTAIGSAIGIAGVLLYSLTKQHHEKLEADDKSKE